MGALWERFSVGHMNDNPSPPSRGQSSLRRDEGPPTRDEINIGRGVWIIEKENYGTDKYKQGIVQNILTSSRSHPRGIKVRLTDGSVGRVQWLMEK